MTAQRVERYPAVPSKAKNSLMELWNKEYPKQLSYPDLEHFDRYLNQLVSPSHYLIFEKSNSAIAWAFTFKRDGQIWFAIIVNSQYQKLGLGTSLLSAIKNDNKEICGWVTDVSTYSKADGSPYKSPLSFYKKNGFKILPEVRLETDELTAVKIAYLR
ncbi:hypothetical protein BFP71_16880 [Roseivirga misakiensis]|uniref:N-acetyltransferase domain-containing protein n=2 Tax=Roseivirga misakiensis TaxID=1563681 RepID=A0A1E5T134_9BACT|nr:hypothetical protein BFP71_16880 [Roseivirga misakiensis]